MIMLVRGLGELNRRFASDQIKETAKSAKDFAPDHKFDPGKMIDGGAEVSKAFQRYLKSLPGSLQETLRGVIYYSLTRKEPKPITFSWVAAYDFELTVSESGCGITVLLYGRYPRDLLSEATRRSD